MNICSQIKDKIMYFLLLGICIVVIAVLYNDSLNDVNRSDFIAEITQFQAGLGGLGLGAVTVPAWNFYDYDPRLESVREDMLYPLPGGYSYTPDRLSTVTFFLPAQPK